MSQNAYRETWFSRGAGVLSRMGLIPNGTQRRRSVQWFSSVIAIGVSAVFQFAGIVILARSLGPEEFSIIVATAAVASVAVEFVGLGSGDMLIRSVSRNPATYAGAFGRALKIIAVTLLPGSIAALLAATTMSGQYQTVWVLFLLTLSEIISIRFIILLEQIAIAHHRTQVANGYKLLSAALRFSAIAGACLILGVTSASAWAGHYAAAVVAIVGCCTLHAIKTFGPPEFSTPPGAQHAGLLFSAMQIVRAMQFAMDKVAVAAIASPAAVGVFGMASRVAQFSVLPASALTRITYPTFFARGANGTREAARYGLGILPVSLLIASLSSAGVIVLSFFLDDILGSAYADAGFYLRLLALLPVLSTLQNVAGDILSGSDRQHYRFLSGIAGLLIMALATWTGMHGWGITGAIVGFMLGQFAIAAFTGLAIGWALHDDAKRSAEGSMPIGAQAGGGTRTGSLFPRLTPARYRKRITALFLSDADR